MEDGPRAALLASRRRESPPCHNSKPSTLALRAVPQAHVAVERLAVFLREHRMIPDGIGSRAEATSETAGRSPPFRKSRTIAR